MAIGFAAEDGEELVLEPSHGFGDEVVGEWGGGGLVELVDGFHELAYFTAAGVEY